MDLKEQQLASVEQEIVLRTLARSVARPGCRFLEVGSWCGQSTVVLARVAQEFGGCLFCVDWWRGNPGTELVQIASREDVFSHFWQRLRREGLDDVVIPIRGRCDRVAEVLRAESFQLVFLDADHRYVAVSQDIPAYAPRCAGRGESIAAMTARAESPTTIGSSWKPVWRWIATNRSTAEWSVLWAKPSRLTL